MSSNRFNAGRGHKWKIQFILCNQRASLCVVDHMASRSVCPVCSEQFITHHYVMFSVLLTVDKCQLGCCDNGGSLCVKRLKRVFRIDFDRSVDGKTLFTGLTCQFVWKQHLTICQQTFKNNYSSTNWQLAYFPFFHSFCSPCICR